MPTNPIRVIRSDHGNLWDSGDINAFWGLFSNVLLNLIVLAGLLTGVLNFSNSLAFGIIIPAVGASLIIGNFYYAYMAKRLAFREERDDVAALPYGPSVPHMFLVVLVIMLPVYLASDDPILAWQVGVAWAFLEGVIELTMSIVGPTVRKYTPRAAMIGTLAGVTIAFIALEPAMRIVTVPYLGMTALAIVLAAWISDAELPFSIPGGMAIIIVGIVLGWATGYMQVDPLYSSLDNVGLSLPSLQISHLMAGFDRFSTLIATAIPLGIYNSIECMNNIESAAAAGDEYSAREAMALDGFGTIIGTLFGSPFPSATYIGHPGWKDIGGRIGYSLVTGVVVGTITLLGAMSVVVEVIPLIAVLPILMYIGAVIGAQAFTSIPDRHSPAVVVALLPNILEYLNSQIDTALSAAGTTATEVGYGALAGAGVYYEGMMIASAGGVMVGLLWGAIAVFAIDKKWASAVVVSVFSGLLSYVGVVHAGEIGIGGAPEMAIGYLAMAVVFSYFGVKDGSFVEFYSKIRSRSDDQPPAQPEVTED
jgi:AGZA family xanthine/uracil permease-like MFS transporter